MKLYLQKDESGKIIDHFYKDLDPAGSAPPKLARPLMGRAFDMLNTGQSTRFTGHTTLTRIQ